MSSIRKDAMLCSAKKINHNSCFENDVDVSQPTIKLESYRLVKKAKTKRSHQMSSYNGPRGARNDIALLIVTSSSISVDLLIFIILTFLCQWETYTYRRNVLPE